MAVPYWRLSGFYFCYFATLGAFLPFWSLYLKRIGFPPADIGELTAVLVATKIISPYLWSWLADKSGRSMGLIRITSLLALLAFSGFLYRNDYLWVALVTFVFSFFWNATLPQFEAATLRHLQAQPQHYSRIRLWGSVGFIAAVLGIGHWLDSIDILYLPWIILGLLLSNWIMAWITPEARRRGDNKAADTVWRVLLNPQLLTFFIVYMLLQVAHGPYYAFYSVYLQQYDYSATATGLLWALGVCAEILVFIGMHGLSRRFSLRCLLLSSLLLSTLRWLLIAYGAQWFAVIIAAQLLHAASFGVAHVVAMQWLQVFFGDRHLSKGQALYSSVSFGLGGVLGSFYSGYFWDELGGSMVFAMAAWACGLAFLLAFMGLDRQKPATLG